MHMRLSSTCRRGYRHPDLTSCVIPLKTCVKFYFKEVGSHVVYWQQLCVRYICLGGGDMMKENSYTYGRDKKTQNCLYIYMCVCVRERESWLVMKKEAH
jgi:hypothetical protein